MRRQQQHMCKNIVYSQSPSLPKRQVTVLCLRFNTLRAASALTHALFLSVSLPPSVSGVTTRPSSGAQLLQRLRSISATARSSAPNCSTAQRQYRPLICALSAVVVAEAIGSPRFVASAASARQARNAVTALPTRSAHGACGEHKPRVAHSSAQPAAAHSARASCCGAVHSPPRESGSISSSGGRPPPPLSARLQRGQVQ
mmetsp:Transcript_30706/g.100249  ORF Transcript_30706/g.100249 Transcript_30706/m.100249 type:complete len:200 (+) Transcript_30706:1166-1765(+)